MKVTMRFFAVIITAVFAVSCGKTSYKKTTGGMAYKIIPGKDTQKINPGSIVKLLVTQKLNDSILFSTDGGLPAYIPVSQTVRSYDISEMWGLLHKGDSMIMIQLVDTFMVKFPERIPPYFKKGDRVKSFVRILDVFTSDSLARIDEEKERNQFTEKQVKEVEEYLAKKNIKTQRTPSGAFLEVVKQGEGNKADSGKYVSVNYTGTSWSGVRFDSSTDSTFGHVAPISFTTAQGEMIRGFDEAVQMMNKGMVGKVYIPGMLAYGPQGNPPKIKPYEHLIFDLEVMDIRDKAPEQPAMLPPQKN
jgi:FKBP-type peptidyl-prolyl cis-trans isomerase